MIEKLRAMIQQASKEPEYLANIKSAGNDPWVIASDKMDEFIKADFKFWEPDLRQIEPQ